MDLERHQIELRYEAMRIRDPAREARLAASLAAEGQRHPVLVFRVADGGFVLVDGYRRVRALASLKRDVVLAMDLACDEPEALLRAWRMVMGRPTEALEEGWMVRELLDTHGVSQRDLAQRMGRSGSWICRRLALTQALPPAAVEAVRAGRVCAHTAQKVLVPLARANAADCARLADAAAPEGFTDREVAALCVTWSTGSAKTRELVLTAPRVVLRARDEAARLPTPPKTPLEALLDDLHAATSIARRAHGRMRDGALIAADEAERRRVRHACGDASEAIETVRGRCHKEIGNARPEDPERHPAAP